MQYDLHVHTQYSFDCGMEPERIVRTARKVGLDGIAITDHDAIEGALEARQFASEDFLVIPGFEKETEAGDIQALFVAEMPELEEPLALIDWIHEHGGVAVLPHPFARTLSVEKEVVEKMDAVESFNARYPARKIGSIQYGEKQIRAFAEEYGLSLVGGSDAHHYREIGRGRTIIPAATLTEVREAILRGNTLVTGRDPSLLRRIQKKFRGV